jgi:hypothetical protein
MLMYGEIVRMWKETVLVLSKYRSSIHLEWPKKHILQRCCQCLAGLRSSFVTVFLFWTRHTRAHLRSAVSSPCRVLPRCVWSRNVLAERRPSNPGNSLRRDREAPETQYYLCFVLRRKCNKLCSKMSYFVCNVKQSLCINIVMKT